MDHSSVSDWVRGYERLWRTAGTADLGTLFSGDVRYRVSPVAETLAGLEALAVVWDKERISPDEPFDLTFSVIAVDGDRAVVELFVNYHDEDARYRDLWLLRFAPDGRCSEFEEWYWTLDSAPGEETGE